MCYYENQQLSGDEQRVVTNTWSNNSLAVGRSSCFL